jgi:hypothetical protein
MIKKLKAITLTETVVYISIFSIFMLTLMQFFLSIQVSQDKVYKELELEMNRIFVTNYLEETVQYNFAIDTENSAFDETSSVGVFQNGQESLTYKIISGTLVIESSNGITGLTNNKAIVQTFSLEPILDRNNSISALRMHFKLIHRDNQRIVNNFSTLVRLTTNEI